MNTHRDLIRGQFTRQAVPFANSPGVRDAKVLGQAGHVE
jgi:hypothetical protein